MPFTSRHKVDIIADSKHALQFKKKENKGNIWKHDKMLPASSL